MGPGENASPNDLDIAFQTGKLIAEKKHYLLTGGRDQGVMHAASKGAALKGGQVIGILPGTDKSEMSAYVNIPIVTGMGSGRNNINVLTADIIIAIGLGAGTLSEIALGIKANTPVIIYGTNNIYKGLVEHFKDNSLFLAVDFHDLKNVLIKLIADFNSH